MRLGLDPEVGPAHHRVQIADRGRMPLAVPDGDLEPGRALLVPGVDVLRARNPRLHAGFDQLARQRVLVGEIGNVERSAHAVPVVCAALLVLGALEVGQDRIVVPALAAALAPFVVISRIAAHVDHAVDRAGAAQHLAARLVHDAVVELGFGLAVEHPVDARIVERLVVAERDVDPGIAVLRPGLEQQHAKTAVL
jgi:hypothetical protein